MKYGIFTTENSINSTLLCNEVKCMNLDAETER